MVEIICEYLVREQARGQFELAFGPGGAWSKLFSRSPGFRGATVLRDANDPRRYLAIEVWDSGDQRDQALVEGQDGYAGLLAALEEWTETRTELGTFSVLAQAGVRPISGAGRSRAGRGRSR
mgnify:CR=1 FL=1